MRALGDVTLLILDDWVSNPLGPEQRHDILEIVEDRYGRGATLITRAIRSTAYNVIGEPRLGYSESAGRQETTQTAAACRTQPVLERLQPTSGRSASTADIDRNGRPAISPSALASESSRSGMGGRRHRKGETPSWFPPL